MGLPRKLKNFATFIDGENYMGEMPEVTLPPSRASWRNTGAGT